MLHVPVDQSSYDDNTIHYTSSLIST